MKNTTLIIIAFTIWTAVALCHFKAIELGLPVFTDYLFN